jgi:peptide/nickel transport system permease protein
MLSLLPFRFFGCGFQPFCVRFKPAMTFYILKRVLLFFPTLLGITLITFILMKSLPGDPVTAMVGERASSETIERIRAELGLNKPLPIQYGSYLKRIVTGELGRSVFTNRKIADDLIQKFPNTVKLALAAMLFASFLGIGMGVFAAVKRNTNWDRLVTLLSVGGISIPVFWLGLALMLIFAFYLQWLPPSGMGNGSLVYLIMPAATLGTFSLSYIARVTRSSMLESLSQPYVAAARAKGLSESKIVLKHALKNSLIPVVTLIGLDLGSYLNGAVLTETIFGWDGLGRYALEGIKQRDYPVIMGVVLFGAVIFVTMNLLVDISYHFLDPRVRVKE